MKKTIAMLIVLSMCVALAACAQSAPEGSQTPTTENQQTQSVGASDAEASVQPTEELTAVEETTPDGYKITTYYEGGVTGRMVRCVTEFPDGSVSDCSFYPRGSLSISINRGADGYYSESRFMDDGTYDAEYQMYLPGTMIYFKVIETDGTYVENVFDENGNNVSYISEDADGNYSELYYENGEIFSGTSKGKNEDGSYSEALYENGVQIKSLYDNPATGERLETESFPNGVIKYKMDRTRTFSTEQKFDEEGYCTYYHYISSSSTVECISDDTGKLVKYIQNGEVNEDPAQLAETATFYGFRE